MRAILVNIYVFPYYNVRAVFPFRIASIRRGNKTKRSFRLVILCILSSTHNKRRHRISTHCQFFVFVCAFPFAPEARFLNFIYKDYTDIVAIFEVCFISCFLFRHRMAIDYTYYRLKLVAVNWMKFRNIALQIFCFMQIQLFRCIGLETFGPSSPINQS